MSQARDPHIDRTRTRFGTYYGVPHHHTCYSPAGRMLSYHHVLVVIKQPPSFRHLPRNHIINEFRERD